MSGWISDPSIGLVPVFQHAHTSHFPDWSSRRWFPPHWSVSCHGLWYWQLHAKRHHHCRPGPEHWYWPRYRSRWHPFWCRMISALPEISTIYRVWNAPKEAVLSWLTRTEDAIISACAHSPMKSSFVILFPVSLTPGVTRIFFLTRPLSRRSCHQQLHDDLKV